MGILGTGAKAWTGGKAARGLGKGARKGVKGIVAMRAVRSLTPGGKRGGAKRSSGALLGGGLVGAAIAYFGDPQQGARRRNVARDRALALLRRGGREAAGKAQYAGGVAQGVAAKATPSTGDDEQLDDVTLARKVETEIFRPADAPKGQVSINAENGVVFLRGEVKRPEDINDLVKRARKVDGVQGVENLLHTPGTPAPGRTATD